MAGNPNAMNINNLQVAGGVQDRFRTGAVDMFANFNFGHNAVSAGVQYLKANTMFVDHAVLALHCYIILQANIGANPAVVPSIATFDTPGFFEFSTFKVTHINPHSMTLRRISLLSDDQTAASCVQHAEASFGPIDHDIHFRFPIAGGNAISFLVATMALDTAIKAIDPSLQIPLAAAAVAQPDPLANQIGMLIGNQNAIRGAARVNATNSVDYERMLSFQRICIPGAFAVTLNLSMIGLTAGEVPSAGFFNLVNHIQTWRRILYDHAQMIVIRTTTISDAKLTMLALLRFPSTAEVSISDLASPRELPITFDNVCSLVSRACELFATMWGAPFAAAVLTCARDLCELRDTHCPELTVRQLFSIIERRIHLLPMDDAFSITIPDDNLPPGPKLTAYFRIHHTDNDIHLMLAQARAAAAVVAPPPAAAAATRGNRKRNGPQSSGQTARATRSRGAAAAPVAAPAAAAAAAPRVSRAAVTAWHNTITTMHPALLNNLPCLYWLSKKVGHPCNASPGCPCTNLNNIRPHVTNPAVVQHMNDITAWLATDPWHRFG